MKESTQSQQPECQLCKTRHRSVFCEMSKEKLFDLNINKICNTFKKYQVIFCEGNRPIGIFCINKGKVKISKMGNEGREQIVRFAKEGDLIGYRSVLSNENYSATATVLEDSSVCFIPREIFVDLVQADTKLSLKMMQLLSSDLKIAETRLTELAQKPVRERVAEILLLLREFFGTEKDKVTINIVLTREEFANIVGTATETLIRLFSEFKNDKLIELSGKKIKLLNIPGLVRIANLTD